MGIQIYREETFTNVYKYFYNIFPDKNHHNKRYRLMTFLRFTGSHFLINSFSIKYELNFMIFDKFFDSLDIYDNTFIEVLCDDYGFVLRRPCYVY